MKLRLAVTTLAVLVASVAAHAAPRTIVGTWAPNPHACTAAGDMVTIKPMEVLTSRRVDCGFQDVSRVGGVVTWHGYCETRLRPDQPAVVIAEQRGELLDIRINDMHFGPLMRCAPNAARSNDGTPAAPLRAMVAGAPDGYTAEHNGSLVEVSSSRGTITYLHPSRSMDGTVDIGTTLFRGRIANGAIAGTAYLFRRGCPPAPYAVTSVGYAGRGKPFVLVGHPPIRAPGSCAVVGYGDNANSVLHFDPFEEGDI